MDKDYIPLLSVIVGGLLSTLGGFFANYMLQSKSRDAEKRKLTRDKLEEAYLLSHEVIDWIQKQMKEMAAFAGGEDAHCPIERVVMLIKFYEPKLTPSAVEFAQNVEVFKSRVFEYWKETHNANTKLPVEKFTGLIEQPFNDVNNSYEKFLDSIQNVMHENL